MSGSHICSHQSLNFFLWLERHDLRCAVTPGLSSFSSPEVQEMCQRKPGEKHTNGTDSNVIFLNEFFAREQDSGHCRTNLATLFLSS